MMKKIEKNHDFIFPKVKNDGRIVGRKTYGKVLIILRICNKGGTILDFSDVLIIIIVILALLCVGMYYLNKKGMKRMIQAQDFIDQNRTTVQIFVIDKRQEKPSPSNMPKAVYEQMPKSAKIRKTNLVRAKVGPQIVTLMCDKPVYQVLPVKKNVKVDLAGMYIVGITGMNLEDKKKKTLSEKVVTSANKTMKKQSEKAKK